MKRKRSSETELAVSSSAAAVPARRKTAATTRTRKTISVSPAETESDAAIAPPVIDQVVAATVPFEPTYEQVAALAYSFWESRGYQGGSPEEDWILAEQQLRARTA